MRHKLTFLLMLVVGMLLSCDPSPREIQYGSDMCAYCKMSVVDAKFAAQAVTKKGKVYVFDAIECLIPFLSDNDETEYSHQLVCAYDQPGELVNAKMAIYLVSDHIPSPMGQNLSAYASQEVAVKNQYEKGGVIFDWNGINQKLMEQN